MCQFLQVRKCNCAFCIPNVFSSSAFASALFHYHPVFMTHVLQSLLHLHPHTHAHIINSQQHQRQWCHTHSTPTTISALGFTLNAMHSCFQRYLFMYTFLYPFIHSLIYSFTHSFVRPFIHTKRSHFVRSHSNVQTFSFLHLLILLLRLFLVKR